MQELFYMEEQSSLGSASLKLSYSKAYLHIPKGCSLGLSQFALKSYQNYPDSHLAYGLYI